MVDLLIISLIVTTGTVTSPSEIQVSISLGNILVFLSLRSLSISQGSL